MICARITSLLCLWLAVLSAYAWEETLALPEAGDNSLQILSPSVLALNYVNTKEPDPAVVTNWNFVNTSFQFTAPALSQFALLVNGQPAQIQSVAGFKRRPLYAPLATRDLRIQNALFLQLSAPLTDGQVVEVKNPSGSLWPTNMIFMATKDPLRYSPAIHVNQEGYCCLLPKKAMVGYYLGSAGEMTIPTSSGFQIVDAATGAPVYTGSLLVRPDVGYNYSPQPYQKVYVADFSGFTNAGSYRLLVPGLGVSSSFRIDDGVMMAFARAYALGLYHQRCGTNNALPFTRFTHDPCHVATADVPLPQSSFQFTWNTISNYTSDYANNPRHTAPQIKDPASQRYPFVRTGKIDVSGGHHDSGDYSKYTINSTLLIHYLMFAVDSLPGVAGLDNLGLPESGDGVSDLLQEAKWEADFLSKMQDSDGGFYFLVYPRNREYENNVLPDQGDPQVVWPKTTAVTAAGVAALAQCASSPRFRAAFPAVASRYSQQAQLGWNFLTNAIARFGKDGAYQKITHYGDTFMHDDELAWAACEMYLVTGSTNYQQTLLAWFPNPNDPATRRWGWWRLWECYGAAIRSYAFAARSGRLPANKLDTNYLFRCETEIKACAQEHLTRSLCNAYASSFPLENKSYGTAGWYFSNERAFDLTVAYQLDPRPEYLDAILGNLNYEAGCNPVNICYITGLGWKRQREIVHQYAQNDRRVLPPSGFSIGNIQAGFTWTPTYANELYKLVYPQDYTAYAPYPWYDRWADTYNVETEFVVTDLARSLASLAFVAALTPGSAQAWTSGNAQIVVPAQNILGAPVTAYVRAGGYDLRSARIVWEAQDQEPLYGSSLTFVPTNAGAYWLEVEAQLPDGRRFIAATNILVAPATPPVGADFVWIDDAIPDGGTPSADGGDAWNWIASNPAPFSGSLAHQTTGANLHEHSFNHTSATMTVNTGEVLFCYIYLDPATTPSEVMLQWSDGTWEHRAYWGANLINYGTQGTASRYYMGALPAAGQWVRLEVPAFLVNLEGSTVKGMGFTLYGGQATWDCAGKSPFRASVQRAGNGISVSWNSRPGKTYQVFCQNAADGANWTAASANITATAFTTSWTDNTGQSQRFYRVILK